MKKYIVKSIELYQKHKQIILYLFFGICVNVNEKVSQALMNF